MWPEPLLKYLQNVDSAVQKVEEAYVRDYQQEMVYPDRANLRVRMRFRNGFLLELSEIIVSKVGIIEFLDYRYHFQDDQNRLIFRYDDNPHFPNLEHFPHHRHSRDEVTGCKKPSLFQVLEEAREYVERLHPKSHNVQED